MKYIVGYAFQELKDFWDAFILCSFKFIQEYKINCAIWGKLERLVNFTI